MTLREEVEELNIQCIDLKKKYKEAVVQISAKNRDNEQANQMDQQNKIEKLTNKLRLLEISFQDVEKKNVTLSSHSLSLKSQLKDSEEKVTKYQNYYVPKLKDTTKFQKEIYNEIEKIKQDAELLPSMFRAEVAFRKECSTKKDEAEKKMHSALNVHKKLVGERDDLKNEVERKQRLAIQAIAARGNMK